VAEVIQKLKSKYALALLSGDNDKQKDVFGKLFGTGSELLFHQSPTSKFQYVESLQKNGKRVLMLGDGLNDAGALQQSNVGITLAEDINTFTPSCDAILDAKHFSKLPELLRLSSYSSLLINLSFVVSIAYNIIGLYYAMQGRMKPVIAAVLMPCSTLSIVLISTGVSSLFAYYLGLRRAKQ
jgi:Cu+-exporting ATPase